jgi:hypothetical protein
VRAKVEPERSNAARSEIDCQVIVGRAVASGLVQQQGCRVRTLSGREQEISG